MKTVDMQTRSAGAGAPAARLSPIAHSAPWLLPPLLCFAIYWPGLTAWFQADDFAWLALRLNVHDWHTLLRALFTPMAQGSIRPWSERAYFLVFESFFGWNALPYRLCVFLTQCASLTLLADITRRLTGSRWAGFWAAVFWLVNSSLISPMVWNSTYNQIMCGFFLLGAFWFLVRYTQTGRTSNCVWQWVVFVLGFGALEVNVVYPALAATYTFLLARKHFASTLPLFIPSAIFVVVDRKFAAAASGAYALHFDRAIPATFATYWRWALVSDYVRPGRAGMLEFVILACLTVALLAFAVLCAFRRDWLPIFALAWFCIVLAPVLPLRDHISNYYLALPTIGLALLGAYGLIHAWRKEPIWRVLAIAALAAYIVPLVHFDNATTLWWNRRSLAVERLVFGVARAHQLHPDKAIVLDGVDSNMFWAGVFHHPFRLFGVYNVYLTPGSERHIEAHDATGSVSDFVLPVGVALHAAKTDQLVVYRVEPKRLKAITSIYEETALATFPSQVPQRVDASNPLTEYLFGPEWYPPENGSHWMPRRATVRIGGPQSGGERLYLQGFPAPVQNSQPPMPLRVTVDGIPLPEGSIDLRGTSFEVSFPLPSQVVGKSELLVSLEAGRTLHLASDTRELGLNFGVFEIR